MFQKGEKNPRWKGGTSPYPEHAEMKRNRIIKLKEADCKCEACGKPAYCIHHLDGSKDNHALNNLVVICKTCHGILHVRDGISKISGNTKYSREYGMTLKEMADQFGGSISRYLGMHRKGQLSAFLNKHNQKLSENGQEVRA